MRITPYFGVTIVTSDSRLIWCELHTFWFTVWAGMYYIYPQYFTDLTTHLARCGDGVIGPHPSSSSRMKNRTVCVCIVRGQLFIVCLSCAKLCALRIVVIVCMCAFWRAGSGFSLVEKLANQSTHIASWLSYLRLCLR